MAMFLSVASVVSSIITCSRSNLQGGAGQEAGGRIFRVRACRGQESGF